MVSLPVSGMCTCRGHHSWKLRDELNQAANDTDSVLLRRAFRKDYSPRRRYILELKCFLGGEADSSLGQTSRVLKRYYPWT